MKRKILIEKREGRIRTYFLENEEIVEIHSAFSDDRDSVNCRIGDIYIGKVKNIVSNIGAAFIEISKGVTCYLDLKNSDQAFFTHKSGNKHICIGDELLVQISKEAVKSKVPTVTGNISFTGRFAVLTHGNTRIGVSSKLPKEKRDEYKRELAVLKNDRFGVIVRTNAKDVPFQEIKKEILQLTAEYEEMINHAKTRVCYTCMKSAPPSYISDLKNVYMEGMEEIIINDKELYNRIQLYFQKELPEKTELLRLYDDPSYPLDKLYSTQTALNKALHERAWLKTGGYLIIQPTEALTVIDVNSGKAISKKDSENGALKVNMEAAKESARQIRLRNLSGIIIIDFINMESEENIKQLLREFRKFLSADPIQTTLVDITSLGLIEVTRKKVRRSLMDQEFGTFESEI